MKLLPPAALDYAVLAQQVIDLAAPAVVADKGRFTFE